MECTNWRNISNSTSHRPVARIVIDTDHAHKVNNSPSVKLWMLHFDHIYCSKKKTNQMCFLQKIMSSLKIQKAEAHALYRCMAYNKIGEDSRIIFFYVTRETAFSLFVVSLHGLFELYLQHSSHSHSLTHHSCACVSVLHLCRRWPWGERVSIQWALRGRWCGSSVQGWQTYL